MGHRIVVHGGNSARGPLDDLYVLTAGGQHTWGWERVQPSGDVAAARFGHAMVQVSESSLVLFGGADDNEYKWFNDLYILRFAFHDSGAGHATRDLRTQCIFVAAIAPGDGSRQVVPTPRCGHSLSRAPHSPTTVVMFGGSNTRGALNDLWFFDCEQMRWAPSGPMDGAAPPPRAFHASAVVHRTLIIVGGRNGYDYLNDAFTLQLAAGRWSRLSWSTLGAPFPALAYNQMAAAPTGRHLLIFGGFGVDGTTPLQALLELDGTRLSWKRGEEMPRSRSNHSAVLLGADEAKDAAGGTAVVIFGGFDGYDFCNDLVVADFRFRGEPAPGLNGGGAAGEAPRARSAEPRQPRPPSPATRAPRASDTLSPSAAAVFDRLAAPPVRRAPRAEAASSSGMHSHRAVAPMCLPLPCRAHVAGLLPLEAHLPHPSALCPEEVRARPRR